MSRNTSPMAIVPIRICLVCVHGARTVVQSVHQLVVVHVVVAVVAQLVPVNVVLKLVAGIK